ncbi:hypothetical protein N181_16240 [Sinorhizobium fredii USDA 205]|nr:hypothetical protein N181_16240 [Sinorhizobium fredii USDA 205]GEC32628.1 hypothetical protein EFR01_27990 [Sinorhizobium fredii]GLS07270.1 hypothetical protein GCM10007864_08970 [Sinorhizobium fredii]
MEWRWGIRACHLEFWDNVTNAFLALIPVLVTGIQQRRVCGAEESFQPKDLGWLDSCDEHRNEEGRKALPYRRRGGGLLSRIVAPEKKPDAVAGRAGMPWKQAAPRLSRRGAA